VASAKWYFWNMKKKHGLGGADGTPKIKKRAADSGESPAKKESKTKELPADGEESPTKTEKEIKNEMM
jgi:hypothetical protein